MKASMQAEKLKACVETIEQSAEIGEPERIAN